MKQAMVIAALAIPCGVAYLLGLPALIPFLIFTVFFVLPGVMLLHRTELGVDEKVVLGTLLGLGFFGLGAYYVNAFTFGSLKLAGIALQLALIGGVFFHFVKK